MNFEQIAEIIGGEILNQFSNPEIFELINDSRNISKSGKSGLFFAINGKNHDGHEFLQDLYDKGLRSFIIEKTPLSKFPSDVNICLVNSSIGALHKIAAFQRGNFSSPVIGITGSNGKTIIKEWLAQFLGKDYKVIKSPKSYNSQLGVPLSVWGLSSNYNFAIFEAGISTIDEMPLLQKIIKPTIGIFTNIGSAHEKGFQSIEQKIQEKLKLFTNCQTLIYCKDHQAIHHEISKDRHLSAHSFTWSLNENSDVKIKQTELQHYEFEYVDQIFKFKLPFQDKASIENLFHCISCLLLLKTNTTSIQQTLTQLRPVKMRLELKKGINQCYIIDDTYNNDIGGLQVALQFLQNQNQRDKKTLILSDIPQSSLTIEALYKEVNTFVKNANLDQLIGIGPDITSQKETFDLPGYFFPSTDAFLDKLKDRNFNHEIILVKGARVFGFEKIVTSLVEKLHETILEIDLDAITNNLNFYRNRLQPSCKIMVMVKALAYGSGSAEISNLLQFHKVDYLAVAYTDEAIELRNNGIELPIMVMNPKNDLEQLINYQLEPEVFDMMQLDKLIDDLETKDTKLSIHINLNTGMNRLGFEPEEINKLCKRLQRSKNLIVKSIFTHLAGADSEEHKEFSEAQLNDFKILANTIELELEYSIIKHALNSAGIISFPDHHMDMVRLGIGLHGFDPSNSVSSELDNVSTFKTIVSQIRQVKKGKTIGYSRKGMAEKDSRIATIAIGYADGYSRSFSNGIGQVIINGKKAKVIGNVCMDMTMVDVTDIDVKIGDEVIVFGSELPIEQVAGSINTIPYEILTSVSERVKRVYFSS